MCQSIWSKAHLNVQAATPIRLSDNAVRHNIDLTENGENYLRLKLYPVTNHVLSSDFFVDDMDGNRKTYPDPTQKFKLYRVFHDSKHSGIIVEDKEDNTMHGTLEIDNEQYLVKGKSAEEGSKNIYHLKQVPKENNVLPKDFKDYIEFNATASKLVKKAKTTDTNSNFKGPYYIEAVFYTDASNTLTENELISVAAQVDHILRDPTFENPAYFILKGIKAYRGPAIRSKDDINLFCQYTADAHAKKLEDVSYLLSRGKVMIIVNYIAAQLASGSPIPVFHFEHLKFRIFYATVQSHGYAYVTGMCQETTSCALIDPSSSELALTIGHETGHLNSVQCLSNRGNYKGTLLSDPPNLNLEKSCSFLVDGSFKLNLEESKCDAIRCQKGYSYYDKEEFLDGHPCNPSDNRLSKSATSAICYKGKCEPKNKIIAQDGSWSPWSSWSSCQGDDTIGYEEKKRECNNPSPKFGGQYCQGDKIEYRVCKNKVSRNNANNMALCRKSKPSSTYRALDQSPCGLTCFIGNTYYINGNAADGTLIKTENTLSMCLGGSNRPIGCDNKFDSTAKKDNCGICNGDNSCVPFETEKRIRLTQDKTNITNLKEGTISLLFRLTLLYYQGFNGAGSSIAVIRDGRSYTGNSIKTLTDITYEINQQYEAISSEKLARPLTIQVITLLINFITCNKPKYQVSFN
ncbi:unnamed protein product [Gordionus sp. m RMFG-2023]